MPDEKQIPESLELEKKLTQCQQEREEYLNGWKRAKADLINYQKEEGRRLEEAVVYANAALIRDLVTLIDSFAALERSFQSEPPSLAEASRGGRPDAGAGREFDGIKLIARQFEDVLRRHGAEKISPAASDEFNPRLHEAVGEVELSAEEKNLDGRIVQVLSTGYQLRDRVIRPARVKLGKGKNI